MQPGVWSALTVPEGIKDIAVTEFFDLLLTLTRGKTVLQPWK